MANYCSFGYSARVVLGLEKHRTKSRVGNMIRFFIEGIKKQTYNRCPPANRSIALRKCICHVENAFFAEGKKNP